MKSYSMAELPLIKDQEDGVKKEINSIIKNIFIECNYEELVDVKMLLENRIPIAWAVEKIKYNVEL